MTAIVVFIHALLLHLARETGRFAIVLDLGEVETSQSKTDVDAQ